ncbi:MAG: RNA polymerase sigma factor [Cyclobacteriaceae bacterium]|jgi:RNA polymerase sigma-70 factor (ECF subfamily)
MHLKYFKNEILPLKDKLFRYAFSYNKDKSESEDIVQEVFIRLWQKRKNLDKIKNIEAWSMTITRNLTFDKLKANRLEFNDLHQVEDKAQEISNPEQMVEQSETMAGIRKIIDSLSEKQKQVIFLRDIEGHTYQEIGNIMGIDQNLVKVTLFRARENVRKKLLKTDQYGL